MTKIVCATRGGEACRRTQETAIALAQERDAELTFLYVVDAGFVQAMDEPLAAAVSDEMSRLGRALLRIAQSRASEQGLLSQAIIRHGRVQQSIKDYLQEVGASTLVLGCPRTDVAVHAFTQPEIQNYADSIQQELDIEVILVT